MTNGDQQPPWGQKRPAGPEDIIAALIKKIKESFDGSGGSGGAGAGGGFGKMFLTVAVIIILITVAGGSFYTIKPGERGVVLRFGAYSTTTNPGLNFKIPIIDDVVKVDIETVRKEEFGFRTRTPGQRTDYAKKGYESESRMLTGDTNIIDVEWIVQYKVRDPFNFIFKVYNVTQAVRDVSETAMRRIVGNMDFDYVLGNREILAAKTAKELQDVLNSYESGVDIVTVQLQDVNPPEAVKPAFNEVNEAEQDMKRLVNEAEEAYNRVIPKARGSAKQTLEEAHGYAVERVNAAKGDTARYLAVLKEYRAAKDVTRRRLYLETMQEILPSVTDIYVIDKDQRSILPFLDVGRGQKAGVSK
jgi:membrane protease subunit HflK